MPEIRSSGRKSKWHIGLDKAAGSPSLGVLWQSVFNLVVVALFRDKDVHGQRSVGWFVEDAHSNCGPVVVDWIPEQGRTTSSAEASSDLL